jgi:flagellar biosynthesis protein FlhF
MKIKRYEVIDMSEAIRQIREDLGPDALILSVKKIKKGSKVFGFFSRPLLEVTAAGDIPYDPSPKRPSYQGTELLLETIKQEFTELKTSLLPRLIEKEVHCQLQEFKDLLSSLRPDRPYTSSVTNPKNLYQYLVSQGVDCLVAQELVLRMGRHLNKKRNRKVGPQLLDLLLDEVQKMLPRFPITEGQRIMVLLGPTGVGKTTTIAKLAGEYTFTKGKKVAVITTDTYRIASIEQLKTYGNTLGIPIHTALNRSDLQKFIAQNNDKDLILIDTYGCNPRDRGQLLELRQLLPPEASWETHLVLSITTREEDLKNIINRFHTIPIHYLLFTKLDEGCSYAAIINQPLQTKKPVSFLTTGQRVPEDIEIATPERIAHLVLNMPFNISFEEELAYDSRIERSLF